MSSLPTCRQLALAASLLLAPLGAQTAAQSANRFVPANSTMVMRIASPAKWRQQFAKTQAVKLLQSNTLSPMVTQVEASWQMALDEARNSGMFDADLLESMVSDWQGDLVLSLQMDFAALMESLQMGEAPAISGTVVFTPGGDFDMAKFGAEVLRATEEQNEMHDLVVGAHTLRTGSPDGEMSIAIGANVDGALVMLFGSDLEAGAERLMANEQRFAAPMGDGPMFLHMDLSWIPGMVEMAVGNGAPPEAAEMISGMMRTLGFQSLQGLSLNVDTDAEHVLGDFQVQLAAGERGIFDAFTGGNASKLLRAVPSNAEAFSVSALNLGKLYEVAAATFAVLGDEAPMSFEQAMQAFADATKVRLKEDLLDHLGGEMMQVQDVQAMIAAMSDVDPDEDPTAMFGGTVYGLSLKNGAAFGKSLETALRARGMHAGRKTEEYANRQLHRLKLGGLVEIEYTVTDDLLLVGIGSNEATSRTLRSILDTCAAGETELPEAVQKQVAGLQPGWTSIGVMPLSPMMNLVSSALAANPNVGEEGEMARMILTGLAQEMTRLGIGTMTSATYVGQKGITARMRW